MIFKFLFNFGSKKNQSVILDSPLTFEQEKFIEVIKESLKSEDCSINDEPYYDPYKTYEVKAKNFQGKKELELHIEAYGKHMKGYIWDKKNTYSHDISNLLSPDLNTFLKQYLKEQKQNKHDQEIKHKNDKYQQIVNGILSFNPESTTPIETPQSYPTLRLVK